MWPPGPSYLNNIVPLISFISYERHRSLPRAQRQTRAARSRSSLQLSCEHRNLQQRDQNEEKHKDVYKKCITAFLKGSSPINDGGKWGKQGKNSRNGTTYKRPVFSVTSAKGGVGSPEREVVSAIACLRTTVRGNLFSLSWISVWFPPSQLPQQSVPSFYRYSVKMYFLLFVPNLLMAGVPLVLTVWEILKNVYFFHILCGIPNSMDPDGICRSL